MKLLTSIIFIFITVTSNAQWECRSNLSGHLKPLYNGSNINWAAEVIGGAGYLTNSSIANGMTFLGVDYTKNNHQFFVEGGVKYWNKNDFDLNTGFSQTITGLRELSYSYNSPLTTMRVGLQQMRTADYFLLNERAWGASLNQKIGGFEMNVSAATVIKANARNGTFCSNGFLYDIVPVRNYPLGNTFGETNFMALTLNKDRTKENKSILSSEAKDEFDEFSEFESTENQTNPFLKSYGAILYSEFGNYYNYSK